MALCFGVLRSEILRTEILRSEILRSEILHTEILRTLVLRTGTCIDSLRQHWVRTSVAYRRRHRNECLAVVR